MRVLHVIPALAPRYGGPSDAIVQMCRALLRREVEVMIATTDADGRGRLAVPRGARTAYAGVPTLFFPRQWSEAFKYSRPLARWLGAQVGGFDAVHIHAVFSHACLAAAAACRRRGVPYVVRPLGSLDPWSLRQKAVRKRLLWHLGVKRMLDGAAAIHYTTAGEQRLAEGALGIGRGVVIPLGIDESLLAPAAAEGAAGSGAPGGRGAAPYVLILSRLHPKKAVDLFAEVFLEVTRRAEFGHWRLVIAGDGEARYVATLKRRVAQAGGAERVRFTGWLSGPDKVAAVRGAALLALASHQENFGIAVVEALACGVPVLISRGVNLADEVAAAGAGWVAPLERQALAGALAEALRDGDARARRGAAGRALALARFTWPPVATELERLYHSVAAAPGGPAAGPPRRHTA